MSEPLSIAAGVVGILTAAAQVSTLLINFTKATKHAPARARHVMTEVNDISGTLSHLQSFLFGIEYADTSRTSLLKADHIVTIISGCVMTFSELEKLLDALKTKDMRILDGMKWARKEKDITTLIQRLQHHKTSLSLMLDILNGLVHNLHYQGVVLIVRSNTIIQAKASVDRLHDVVNQCYQEMSTRLHALELKELQRMDHAASILDDNTSIRHNIFVPNFQSSSQLNIEPENGTIAPDFLGELKRSWVYSRNSAFRMSTFSADRHSTTWSCLSALSLSDVSNISIFDLAITMEEVQNPQRQSQTWSNDQVTPIWPSQSGTWAPDPTMLLELKAIPAKTTTPAPEPDNETSSIVTLREGPEIDGTVLSGGESKSQVIQADESLSPIEEDEDGYPCKGCGEVRCSTPLHSL